MNSKFKVLFNKIRNLIFPNHIKCIFCGDELNTRSLNDTCENCLKTLPFIVFACPRCGNPLKENDLSICLDCKNNNYAFDSAGAVFEYSGAVKDLIHNIKYNGKKYLIEPISNYLVQHYATSCVDVDYITSVPMLKAKEKQRSFNQSQLLAKCVGEKLNIPFVEFCVKTKETPSQTTLSIKDRKSNVIDSFDLNDSYKSTIKNKVILVVDDVFTTGATSNEICKTLIKNGAKACYVLTIAHSVIDKEI